MRMYGGGGKGREGDKNSGMLGSGRTTARRCRRRCCSRAACGCPAVPPLQLLPVLLHHGPATRAQPELHCAHFRMQVLYKAANEVDQALPLVALKVEVGEEEGDAEVGEGHPPHNLQLVGPAQAGRQTRVGVREVCRLEGRIHADKRAGHYGAG